VAARAMAELSRIVRPGGLLCITEPAEEHIKPKSLVGLVREHGFGSLYFHTLARLVYEPFLADWQSIHDHAAWLSEHGFELIEREVRVPFATLVARRR
jgi:SAM-dependent methyltransferase